MIQQDLAVASGSKIGWSMPFAPVPGRRDILASAAPLNRSCPSYLGAEVISSGLSATVLHPKSCRIRGLLRMTAWADPVKAETLNTGRALFQ